MKKHAYCILAHGDRYCLDTLIELLDDPRNDIYIHFDRKSSALLEAGLQTRSSGLTILPPEERVDVRWGDISLVEAELAVMGRAARAPENYAYIHLISGNDLPLKTQDEIHEFFDSVPEGSNFVEISEGEHIEKSLRDSTDYYYLFTPLQRKVGKGLLPTLSLFFARCMRHGWVILQKMFGYKRDWKGLKLARGVNWVSVSKEFARYLDDRKDEILRRFRNTIVPDEIYKQTLIINSPFDHTVRAFSRGNSDGIRLIDWERGNGIGSPKTWTMDDWEEIDNAFELFARKFSSSQDREVIDRLKAKLDKKKSLE